jgi:hypothetical protein
MASVFVCREGQDYTVFQGNTSSSAHLTTLLVDGEFVLLGGRNLVHKLTLQDLRVGDLYLSCLMRDQLCSLFYSGFGSSTYSGPFLHRSGFFPYKINAMK